MSWIGGSVVINDTSKTELDEAVMHITSHIRHEADLEEFPNICSRNRIVVKNETVFESFDDAEEYSKSSSNEWRRQHNICLPFKDTSEAKDTKKIFILKNGLKRLMINGMCISIPIMSGILKLHISDVGPVALKSIRNISGTTIVRSASQNSAPRL